jgi:hypothetical protein
MSGGLSAKRSQFPSASSAERPSVPAPFALAPHKLAIVARDWGAESASDGFRHYEVTPHIPRVIQFCAEKGCDTVIFSLWTHCGRLAGKLTDDELLPVPSRRLNVVAGEVFDCESEKGWREKVVIANRGRRGAALVRLKQRFAKTKDRRGKKEEFLRDLPARTFGGTLIMLCGEVNIISTTRTGGVVDPFRFRRTLEELDIRLILNPAHTYSRLHWLKEKRRVLSRGGRTVVTVWNAGNETKGEPAVPWLVHRDGKLLGKDEVKEVKPAQRPIQGVRIGIMKL